MIFSGVAMVILGVWLTLQALGGNLTGRIRSLAGNAPSLLSLGKDVQITPFIGSEPGDVTFRFEGVPTRSEAFCVAAHLKAGVSAADAGVICKRNPQALP